MSAAFVVEEFTAVVRNTLRGFARVRLPSGMVLHDVAVHEKDGHAWASTASKARLARDGAVIRDATNKIQYSPVVGFASRELRARFSDQVIAALRDRFPEVLT